ncbi:MAG: T9SS type A sorting domain-containing protein, partial [Prevotellaceae bacterium]|nr:T9SS type A sorting domain-containing protein [Prevotellaceae bacterium]
GYVKGYKVGTVEVDLSSLNGSTGSSIGSTTLYMQNGSSGNSMTITTSYYDGSAWVETETREVAGNTRDVYSPATLVTKSKVQKIRFAFSNSSWFCAVKVVESATADGAPAFVTGSEIPVAESYIPSSGSITLQFDELIKAGTAPTGITLGDATITGVVYKGNTAVINYSGATVENQNLFVSPTAITDLAGNSLAAPVSIQYLIDKVAPLFGGILPDFGTKIHINDLGLDANKIKVTFNEPIKIGTGEISFNGATVTPTVSGNVLTIGYSGLPYDALNPLIIPAGFITDLSGNPAAEVSTGYETNPRDNTPPALTSTLPGGTLPIGGSFSFTFDEIVEVAAQTATVNGQPAILSNNGNVIGLNYTNVPYASNIEVIIPANAIADTIKNGNTHLNFYASEIKFTFASEAKTPKAFDMIVGEGETYTTIQSAIDAISNEAEPTLIFVKNGTYTEKLAVWKDNVSLIGESRDGVIITWNECSSTSTLQNGAGGTPNYYTGINSTGTDASYTMLINGNNFYGENFTVRNDFNHSGASNTQAVAIEHKDGDKHVLKNVTMFSFQDTYYPKSANVRQYIVNADITGGTDFIFGSGTCYLEKPIIRCYEGGQYITAASDTQKEFGIVINNATVQYAGLTPIGSKRAFYLGRPWKASANTAFLNSSFESGLIQAAGWTVWSDAPTNHLSADYYTYNNTGFATTNFVDWSKQLTDEQAKRFNMDNAFNYGEGNVWNPLPLSTAPEKPTNVQAGAGNVITWDAVDFAVGYLVFKNDVYLGQTTDLTYTDESIAEAAGEYSVKAYNAYGAMSLSSNDEGTGTHNPKIKTGFLKNTLVNTGIELKNPAEFSSIEIFSVSGQKIFATQINSSFINVSALPTGIYYAKGLALTGEIYLDKIIKN